MRQVFTLLLLLSIIVLEVLNKYISQSELESKKYMLFADDIGLPWWFSSKESTWNTGDAGSIPGSGRSPGGGHGNPLQCSCLENPMDRGAWWATVYRAAKSRTWLSNWACTACRWHKSHTRKYIDTELQLISESGKAAATSLINNFYYASICKQETEN